jgi:WD40 repeat protein
MKEANLFSGQQFAMSADGQRLALASTADIRLYSARTGRQERTMEGQGERFWSAAFSPDGATLAAGDNGGKVSLWNTQSGERLRTIEAGEGRISSIAFSPDGQLLATGCHKPSWQIRMWSPSTGRSLGTIVTRSPGAMAFSPDGKSLASPTGDSITLWYAKPPFTRILVGHENNVCSTAFSPDGKMLASGSYDEICLWDLATGTRRAKLVEHEGLITHLAFSVDGRTLLSVSESELRLWDLMMGVPRHVLSDFDEEVRGLSVSPDGKLVATTCEDRVDLWNIQSGARVRAFEAESKDERHWYWAAAFSPDGRSLAIGCESGRTELRDVASGQIEKVLAVDAHAIQYVAFSPDGKSLATGTKQGDDDWIKIWDLDSGRIVTHIEVGDENFTGIAFSPDGRKIASGTRHDDLLMIWSTETGEMQHKASCCDIRMFHGIVSFSPDGRFLAFPSNQDNAVQVMPVPLDPQITGVDLPVASFTGSWEVPAGPLTLQVRDGVVTGTFPVYNGRVEGVLSDDRKMVTGTWLLDTGLSGGFVLEMAPNGKSIEGRRWVGDKREDAEKEFPWSGKRIEE